MAYDTREMSTPYPMGFFITNNYGTKYHRNWNLLRMRTRKTTYSFRTEREDEIVGMRTRNGFTTFDPETDKGHEFWTFEEKLPLLSHSNHTLFRPSGGLRDYRARYVGPLLLRATNENLRENSLWEQPWDRPSLSSSDLGYYGSQAIAATRPLNPVANLSQTGAELIREGLPSLAAVTLWKERTREARRAVGSEYLNYQFGWLPLVADIKKIAKAIAWSSHLTQQAYRDSGRQVRRRFRFPEVESFVQKSYKPYMGGLHIYQPSGGTWVSDELYQWSSDQQVDLTERQTRKIWFSGAYTYLLPDGGSALDRIAQYEKKANLLLGTRITPETLWELAPWSWFVDWFATIGPVLGNLSALSDDNLVMRYGYLMCTTNVRTEISTPNIRGWNGNTGTVTNVFQATLKERRRATPYGFGLNPSTFSARQWAILAALGMTKAPNVLR